MLTQFLSISKFSTISALSIALVIGSISLASAERSNQKRNQIVKAYTDLIYYKKLYPEFGNRRLQSTNVAPGDRAYWVEWRAIYQAVDREINYGETNCGDGVSYNWKLKDYDRQTSSGYTSRSLNRIADVVFEQRRTQLGKVVKSDWNNIRKQIEMTDRTACFLP
jgi:hypothetical protein